MATVFTHLLLKAELTNDPLAIGYSGMTVGQAAAALNDRTRARSVDRKFVDRNEVLAALVLGEYTTATAAQRNWLDLICSADVLDIRAPNIRNGFGVLFGAGTTTRTNLTALQTRLGSRAEELWGEDWFVTVDDVSYARSL